MTHGDLWEQISGGMRDQSSPVLFYLVLGGGFIAVLVITLIIFRWWTSPGMRARRSCRVNFNELAKVNGLSLRQRDMLWKVARMEGLADPLEIYFRRSIFEAKIGHTPATLDVIFDLRQKLYRF